MKKLELMDSYDLYELSNSLETKLASCNVPYDLISEIKEKYFNDNFYKKSNMFNKKVINYVYRNYIFSLLTIYNGIAQFDVIEPYYKRLEEVVT